MLSILIAIMFTSLGLFAFVGLEKMNIAIRNKLKYTHLERFIDIILVILGVIFGLSLITYFVVLFI